jgi:hypothetical protein
MSIKVNGFNLQSHNTLKNATQIGMKAELRFLYVKKKTQ